MPYDQTKPNHIHSTYSSKHKDQNDVKKKSKCKIKFYFKSS